MLNKKRSFLKTAISITVSVVLLATAAWVLLNRQFVVDQISVWQYTPSPQIASISQKAGMSDKGTFYFYASNPAINNAAEFNVNCQRQEAQAAILGCYANRSIYVYDVNNAELSGIEEVTAAHETLHAAWDRLSDEDKSATGVLLEKAYASINDPALTERMDYYARNEPGERTNELHSILGTEYPNIGTELEAYYKTYFSDRSKVVALHTNYNSIFKDLRTQSDTLLSDIQSRKAVLDKDIATYNTSADSLEADYNALKATESSVDRTSASQVNAYNAKLSALRVRSNNLSTLRSNILALQAAYNVQVTSYNKLVVVSNNLASSLDSTLSTSPDL